MLFWHVDLLIVFSRLQMALGFDADIFYYTGISLTATLSGKVLKTLNYFSLLIGILETLEPASYLAVVSATVGVPGGRSHLAEKASLSVSLLTAQRCESQAFNQWFTEDCFLWLVGMKMLSQNLPLAFLFAFTRISSGEKKQHSVILIILMLCIIC